MMTKAGAKRNNAHAKIDGCKFTLFANHSLVFCFLFGPLNESRITEEKEPNEPFCLPLFVCLFVCLYLSSSLF
jgi:hypothetical protein